MRALVCDDTRTGIFYAGMERRLHSRELEDIGRGAYRICIDGEDRKYVAWKAWEGFVLTEEASLACPFNTPKLAREVGKQWTHHGPVFVERLVEAPKHRGSAN